MLSPRARYNLSFLSCVIGGSLLGGAIGIAIPAFIVLRETHLNPSDHSAGSVGIIVIATFPLGLIVGFLAGTFATARLKKPETPKGFDIKLRSNRPGADE